MLATVDRDVLADDKAKVDNKAKEVGIRNVKTNLAPNWGSRGKTHREDFQQGAQRRRSRSPARGQSSTIHSGSQPKGKGKGKNKGGPGRL